MAEASEQPIGPSGTEYDHLRLIVIAVLGLDPSEEVRHGWDEPPVRPFVVPGSLAELDGPTVSGRVHLPLHLDWSSGREYDLDDPVDRARVYGIVLREGTLEDLLTCIDPTRLPDALQRMFLPSAIAEAWCALLDAEPSGLGR